MHPRLTIGNGTEEGLLYDALMLYDLNGNRLGKTGQRMGVEGKQEMNTVFCYDSMNRLTMKNRREGGEKYAYDLNGNRLSKQRYHYALTAGGNMDSVIDEEESYCYNERNELTERRSLSAVTAYLYDENGSLIKEKEGEKETGYRYDLLNRQTHVQLPDGREQENLYDGEGLRAGLTENGKSTTFLFYNGEILAECDGDSAPIRRHLAGVGLSHVQNLENNTFHAYHQDEQESTAYVTGITGGTENLYSYDGFGNLLESKEDITNRILYTGQQYDQETGQYYLRARYYNPVIGRFTQEDTYRGDGLNLYAYCDNNPVMYYDPSGHEPCQGQEQKETAPQPVDGVGEGAREAVNIDTGTAVAFVSEDSPIRHELKEYVQGKDMVMTETALGEFENIVEGAGGALEKGRAERFLDKVSIIPDDPSVRAMELQTTKKVGVNDKIIFGTGDNLDIVTMTSDAKFVRGASAQGVNFDVYVHGPMPLKGK